MTVKRRGVRGLGVWAVLAAIAGTGRPAAAHPELSALGTNRYVTAAVFETRVDISDVLLEGGLASAAERRRLDADGDGQISDGEVHAGEQRARDEGPAVTVEVDGRALSAPTTIAIDLGDDANTSAAPVVVQRRASFPEGWPAGARRLRLSITREPPRLVETELSVVLGSGLSLASAKDRVTFQGPRASALEARAAIFEINGPPPAWRGPILIAAGVAGAVIIAFAVRRARTRRLGKEDGDEDGDEDEDGAR